VLAAHRGERLQNHQIECALEQVGLARAHGTLLLNANGSLAPFLLVVNRNVDRRSRRPSAAAVDRLGNLFCEM
jgi:hypothetical protein